MSTTRVFYYMQRKAEVQLIISNGSLQTEMYFMIFIIPEYGLLPSLQSYDFLKRDFVTNKTCRNHWKVLL